MKCHYDEKKCVYEGKNTCTDVVRAAFRLLRLDLEFAARLKGLQIASERYFTLGLHIARYFLKTKVLAASNKPKGCAAAC